MDLRESKYLEIHCVSLLIPILLYFRYQVGHQLSVLLAYLFINRWMLLMENKHAEQTVGLHLENCLIMDAMLYLWVSVISVLLLVVFLHNKTIGP